jgi:alanine-glyoxylate transaminase/serine-glyoxylate transaminase/serine-pyruvate transaminase
MLLSEGLEQVFIRHQTLAEATRRAVRAWDLQIYCRAPQAYSQSLTAVEMPPGHDADDLRRLVLAHFDMSLGTGLGPIQGTVFRIGHLGDFNALMLAGTLSGVEMGLKVGGVPHLEGGVQAALNYLADLSRLNTR